MNRALKKSVDDKRIKLFVIDVDGTMTDAGVYYDDKGNELKKFCTKDAAGFYAAQRAGIKIMVLTGRECAATERRMTEMKVDYLIQGVDDKCGYLQRFLEDQDLHRDEVGYIGDDLNDINSMRLCGFVGCPEDACREVAALADYHSPVAGGHGAVRDVIEHVLRARGEWEKAVEEAYGI